MACPLCACPENRPSWLGSTCYLGGQFDYVECRSCRTLYCNPMPSSEIIARMYGVGYSEAFPDDPGVDDPKEPHRTIEWLQRADRGVFVDFGCRDGDLLIEAAKLGWRSFGIEFDPEVAVRTERKTGIKVFSDTSSLLSEVGGPVDMLHLGDVIEHLTELDRQMPEILRLIRPGGILLAQGPLEGNANVFFGMLHLFRAINRRRRYEMAPYHVMLATAVGQRTLFRRFGLEELEYSINEVAWPAPARISARDLANARRVAMYVARRLSQSVSKLFPDRLGNRYYYAARRPA